MNTQLTIVKKSINIHDDHIEIHYAGFIENKVQYDSVVEVTKGYLLDEGFFDNSSYFGFIYHVYDYAGRPVHRENDGGEKADYL